MYLEFNSRWLAGCAVVLSIALVVFLGHFLRLFSFGFYENNFWALIPNLTQLLNYLVDVFVGCFRAWPTGRPLNHFLPVTLAICGYKLGGVPGIYGLAAAALTLNALLVYAIVRRLFPYPSALLAAFVYVLFPADTTKILLIHVSNVQDSMTFLLAGIFFWQRSGFRRGLSYPVATLSLLSYESAFLPFLAVPLLWAGDRRSTWKTWRNHLGFCAAIIALIAIIRLYTDDVLAGSVVANLADTVRMLLTSLYLGALTSLRMLGKDAWIGIQYISLVGFCSTVFIAWVVALCRPAVMPTIAPMPRPTTPVWPMWLNRARTDDGHLPWWWILFALYSCFPEATHSL